MLLLKGIALSHDVELPTKAGNFFCLSSVDWKTPTIDYSNGADAERTSLGKRGRRMEGYLAIDSEMREDWARAHLGLERHVGCCSKSERSLKLKL